MNYWRFLQITKVAHKINLIKSGRTYVEQGALPESTKDMIKRRKKLRR